MKNKTSNCFQNLGPTLIKLSYLSVVFNHKFQSQKQELNPLRLGKWKEGSAFSISTTKRHASPCSRNLVISVLTADKNTNYSIQGQPGQGCNHIHVGCWLFRSSGMLQSFELEYETFKYWSVPSIESCWLRWEVFLVSDYHWNNWYHYFGVPLIKIPISIWATYMCALSSQLSNTSEDFSDATFVE